MWPRMPKRPRLPREPPVSSLDRQLGIDVSEISPTASLWFPVPPPQVKVGPTCNTGQQQPTAMPTAQAEEEPMVPPRVEVGATYTGPPPTAQARAAVVPTRIRVRPTCTNGPQPPTAIPTAQTGTAVVPPRVGVRPTCNTGQQQPTAIPTAQTGTAVVPPRRRRRNVLQLPAQAGEAVVQPRIQVGTIYSGPPQPTAQAEEAVLQPRVEIGATSRGQHPTAQAPAEAVVVRTVELGATCSGPPQPTAQAAESQVANPVGFRNFYEAAAQLGLGYEGAEGISTEEQSATARVQRHN